ncbi:hypothetical protein QLX08_009985 [Tetragonisca angustula]|uniref:Uncharacterized protein n=1 Tax=Tetragonisca angustula TaxID=166442 RepID=A0AAW0ZDR4_9HYME
MISPRLSFEITTSPMDILPLGRFVRPAFPRHVRPVLTTFKAICIDRASVRKQISYGDQKGKKGNTRGWANGHTREPTLIADASSVRFTRCFLRAILLGLSADVFRLLKSRHYQGIIGKPLTGTRNAPYGTVH